MEPQSPTPSPRRTRTRVPAERLSDRAYRLVLEGLFDRKVPVGAFVSQNELVELFGIPVQPLRDALRVLEAEGVLAIHARSGIQFLKPDLEFARSTYQFRTLIERAAARRFAETAPHDLVDTLIADHRALIGDLEDKGFHPDAIERLDQLEERLHGGMLASLTNPLVETTARRLKNYVRLIRLERLVTEPLAMRTLHEHIEILEACRRNDPDTAEAALARHFAAALERILALA